MSVSRRATENFRDKVCSIYLSIVVPGYRFCEADI